MELRSRAANQQRWNVAIRRVEYDHRAWVRQLKREGVDSIFTEPLRTGWWTTGINSLPLTERRSEGKAHSPGESLLVR